MVLKFENAGEHVDATAMDKQNRERILATWPELREGDLEQLHDGIEGLAARICERTGSVEVCVRASLNVILRENSDGEEALRDRPTTR